MARPVLNLLAVSFMPLLNIDGAAAKPSLCPPGAIQQLRIYEIFEHNKAAFHDRFRDHASRIMRRYGFEIIAQWETRHGERTEFAYVLDWPDEATMKRRWAAFMADEEWSTIKQRTAATHGALVGEIEDRVLLSTTYSPLQQQEQILTGLKGNAIPVQDGRHSIGSGSRVRNRGGYQ